MNTSLKAALYFLVYAEFFSGVCILNTCGAWLKNVRYFPMPGTMHQWFKASATAEFQSTCLITTTLGTCRSC